MAEHASYAGMNRCSKQHGFFADKTFSKQKKWLCSIAVSVVLCVSSWSQQTPFLSFCVRDWGRPCGGALMGRPLLFGLVCKSLNTCGHIRHRIRQQKNHFNVIMTMHMTQYRHYTFLWRQSGRDFKFNQSLLMSPRCVSVADQVWLKHMDDTHKSKSWALRRLEHISPSPEAGAVNAASSVGTRTTCLEW